MDRHKISVKALAKELGLSSNSICNYRRTSMARIDGERLNDILVAINTMTPPEEPLITPEQILLFSLTPEELKKVQKKARAGQGEEAAQPKG